MATAGQGWRSIWPWTCSAWIWMFQPWPPSWRTLSRRRSFGADTLPTRHRRRAVAKTPGAPVRLFGRQQIRKQSQDEFRRVPVGDRTCLIRAGQAELPSFAIPGFREQATANLAAPQQRAPEPGAHSVKAACPIGRRVKHGGIVSGVETQSECAAPRPTGSIVSPQPTSLRSRPS